MAKVTVTITGGEEIQRKLREIDNAVSRRIMREALLAAAEPIREDASRRAPRRTGFLARHIIAEPVKGKTNQVVIGPTKDAFYGLFQELGTSRHRAQPFLRPALEAKKGEAERRAAAVLRAGIEREAR